MSSAECRQATQVTEHYHLEPGFVLILPVGTCHDACNFKDLHGALIGYGNILIAHLMFS